MKTRNVSILISLWIITAMGLALAASTANAENAAGVEYRTISIKRDLADLQFHLLDTGHFALETYD